MLIQLVTTAHYLAPNEMCLNYVFVLQCINEGRWLRIGSIYVSQITLEESLLNIFLFSCCFLSDRESMQQRHESKGGDKVCQNLVCTLHTLQFLSSSV